MLLPMSLSTFTGAHDWWTLLVEAVSYPGVWSLFGWSLFALVVAALVASPIFYWLRMRPWRA